MEWRSLVRCQVPVTGALPPMLGEKSATEFLVFVCPWCMYSAKPPCCLCVLFIIVLHAFYLGAMIE